MRLYDISVTLDADTPPWPGDTPFSCEWSWLISRGKPVNVSALTASPHVGTHADAPFHVRDDWSRAHELPLDAFCGEAMVVDVSQLNDAIDSEQLASALASPLSDAIRRAPRLLLRTGRTIADGKWPHDWPCLTERCAQEVLRYGLRLIGTDAPSVDPEQSRELEVHHAIFAGNACILENLDLRRVPEGRYRLLAFPLKLKGTDAAPVRAVLEDL